MSRLPDIDTEHLTAEQAELYEALLSRPEVARLGLIGPFGVWMHAPDLGKAMSGACIHTPNGPMSPSRATSGRLSSAS